MWGLWGVVQENLMSASNNVQFNYLVSLSRYGAELLFVRYYI